MIEETLFSIPYWTIPTIKFKKKKQQLINCLKKFPDKRHGIQPFATNRQNIRTGLAEEFTQICGEELKMLSDRLNKVIRIDDIWTVTYKNGEYHSPHNHGSVGLTGILYLQMDSNSPVTHYVQPWNDYVKDNTIYHPLPVVEGTIVVVPQFIQHFSPPNKSKKIKRILSWDMTLLDKK